MSSAKSRPAPLVKPPSTDRRNHAVEAGRIVSRLAAPALKKHGAVDAELRKRWPSLVGDKIARFSTPDRLRPGRQGRGGTLLLRVESGAGTLIEPQAPFLIEVINQYYGWRAVEKLEFSHGTVIAAATPAPAHQAPRPAESTPMQALARLGAAIKARAKAAD